MRCFKERERESCSETRSCPLSQRRFQIRILKETSFKCGCDTARILPVWRSYWGHILDPCTTYGHTGVTWKHLLLISVLLDVSTF